MDFKTHKFFGTGRFFDGVINDEIHTGIVKVKLVINIDEIITLGLENLVVKNLIGVRTKKPSFGSHAALPEVSICTGFY